MKVHILSGILIMVCCFGSTVFAQESTNFEQALEQAQAENKGVALFLYSSSLDTPQSLDEVLPDDWSIQVYLERYYVSISVDADSEEGNVLASQYASLDWFPALSLFDSEGERKVFYTVDSQNVELGDWAHLFLKHELMTGRLRTNE